MLEYVTVAAKHPRTGKYFFVIVAVKNDLMFKQNVVTALRLIGTQFCSTDEGQKVYEYNGNKFFLKDLIDNIPTDENDKSYDNCMGIEIIMGAKDVDKIFTKPSKLIMVDWFERFEDLQPW